MYMIKEEAVIIETLIDGEMVVVPLTSSTLNPEIQEVFDRWTTYMKLFNPLD